MREYTAKIVENIPIAENIQSLTFELREEPEVRAGQFAELSDGGGHLLRRPLAVCRAEEKRITVCFQIKGEGTKLLALKKPDETLNVLMPLGNGFFVAENEKKVALVGGGVGIFPMISVLRDLGAGYSPDVVLSCGPVPMLRALKEALSGKNIPCFVSLEERMGCGIGACLVCVCNLTNGEHARVCKDGPVFDIRNVIL